MRVVPRTLLTRYVASLHGNLSTMHALYLALTYVCITLPCPLNGVSAFLFTPGRAQAYALGHPLDDETHCASPDDYLGLISSHLST